MNKIKRQVLTGVQVDRQESGRKVASTNRLPEGLGDNRRARMEEVRGAMDGPEEELIATPASQVEEAPIYWLWPRRFILQEMNMIAGHPGVGKSFITVTMAALLSTGRDWPDGAGKAQRGHTIIMSTEDDYARVIVPRLKAVGADLDYITFLEGKKTKQGSIECIALDADLSLLEAQIVEKKAILVVVDPVLSYVSQKIKPNDEAAVRRDLIVPLMQMAERTGVALVGITHLNKKQDLDNIQRLGGAMAWVGAPRSSVWVEENGADIQGNRRFTISTLKMNLAKHPKPLSYSIVDVYPDQDIGKIKWEKASEGMKQPNQTKKVRARSCLYEELPKDVPGRPGMPQAEVMRQGAARDLRERVIRDASLDLDGKGLRVVKRQVPPGRGAWHWWFPREERSR